MKVTEEEVQKVIDDLESELKKDIDAEIKLGLEDDGDMVIAILSRETKLENVLKMLRRIRKLGKKHQEVYYVQIMWPSWFPHYQKETGFEEIQKKPVVPPCPLDVRLYADGYVEIVWKGEPMAERIHLSAISEITERIRIWIKNVKGPDKR